MTSVMDRRAFIGALAGGLLAAPLAAEAQRVGSVPTVGVLTPGMASSPLARPSNEAFERGLQEHGWVPGQSIRIEYRYADGKPGRVPQGRSRSSWQARAWIQCVSDSCRI